jgi:hypothetical protein
MLNEQAVQRIAERAKVEADAGAPGPMVAIYVQAEVDHLLGGHDGEEPDCEPCLTAQLQPR